MTAAGPGWDPHVYLRHADDRSRPFVDLLARVPGEPRSIIDLGCGPGHLTDVLRARWPDATVHGVDSSPEMIEAARARSDGASYEQADVATWTPPQEVDLIISNALFQWVPDRARVVRRLTDSVLPGGVFALQVPDNADAPSHGLLRELAAREPYARHTAGVQRVPPGPPEQYLELFAELGWVVDAWSTTYLHVLPGDDPVWSWVSGTGARPVLQALPADLRDRFVTEYQAALREAYPRRSYGTVLPFRRTFAVAQR